MCLNYPAKSKKGLEKLKIYLDFKPLRLTVRKTAPSIKNKLTNPSKVVSIAVRFSAEATNVFIIGIIATNTTISTTILTISTGFLTAFIQSFKNFLNSIIQYIKENEYINKCIIFE